MAIKIGDEAPDFTAETTEGTINFHEWLGDSWGILFSHPSDFTPVCTTELGYAAKLKPEFDRRNVKIIGLSVDTLESHIRWLKDIEEIQDTVINYPIIADVESRIAHRYDMIHPKADHTYTVRTVFLVGPDKKIKLTLTYPMSTGRDFDEILRVIDSVQLTENYNIVTPVNWKKGEDCIVSPTLSDDEATEQFPYGFTKLKPYYRTTPQPDDQSTSV